MTSALSRVALGTEKLAEAIGLVLPDIQVITNVVSPVSPPAVVIGPPRLYWRAYNQGGQPTTGAWNVYLVVSLTQYAVDQLLDMVATVSQGIEVWSPGVVLGAGPGIYPAPTGGLPSYIIQVQAELSAF